MGGVSLKQDEKQKRKKKKDGVILWKQKSTPEGLIVSLDLLKGEAEGKEKLFGD